MYRQRDGRWKEHFSDLLDRFDREPRDPLEVTEMIVALITALVEGLAIRHAVDPSPFEEVDGDGGEQWHLVSLGVLAVLTATTKVKDYRSRQAPDDFWSFVDKHMASPSNPRSSESGASIGGFAMGSAEN